MSVSVRPAHPDDAPAIRDVAAQVERADGVAPFNEASRLELNHLGDTSQCGARALVATEGDEVVGAAIDAEGDGSGVDIAVAPAHRGRGVATELVENVEQAHPNAAFWAHGDLAEAQALTKKLGLVKRRELWKMTLLLNGDERFDTTLPAGFSASGFDGSDAQAQAWLDLNAVAFAHHPEQGRMTMADFRDRTASDWFDPAGLILVWDADGCLAASHWTKREVDSKTGEVYVVAVAPKYQGRGLAKPLTALGLAHLASHGAKEIELYVEGDNEPAKATYSRAGFARTALDAMYVRATTDQPANIGS